MSDQNTTPENETPQPEPAGIDGGQAPNYLPTYPDSSCKCEGPKMGRLATPAPEREADAPPRTAPIVGGVNIHFHHHKSGEEAGGLPSQFGATQQFRHSRGMNIIQAIRRKNDAGQTFPPAWLHELEAHFDNAFSRSSCFLD